jgi:hypothetical protein
MPTSHVRSVSCQACELPELRLMSALISSQLHYPWLLQAEEISVLDMVEELIVEINKFDYENIC